MPSIGLFRCWFEAGGSLEVFSGKYVPKVVCGARIPLEAIWQQKCAAKAIDRNFQHGLPTSRTCNCVNVLEKIWCPDHRAPPPLVQALPCPST